MSEPSIVKLKRKVDEEPLERLVLKRPRRAIDSDEHREAGKSEDLVHYHLRPGAEDGNESQKPKSRVQQQQAAPIEHSEQHRDLRQRRIFELQRPCIPASIARKRKGEDDGIATFAESKKRKQHARVGAEEEEDQPAQTPLSRPLKRPGRGAAVKCTVNVAATAETDEEKRQIEALADYMHQAALDEVTRESRPKAVAQPKLTGAKSRDLHRQRVTSNAMTESPGITQDVDMEDDESYVYDTYVLAPTSDMSATTAEAHSELDNVGYLVITEEDESLWETYLEGEASDKDWNSEEEDENAEDYYGADYPEEELVSDDEFDRDGYAYRDRGARDEEWDEHTGADSDDEHDRMMEPFKNKTTMRQFAKYLDGGNVSD